MPSDLQPLHLLVINRIYHEDQLFAQRTYVLTTCHAFLITAFAIFLRSGPVLLSAFLAILGMGLAIFQATYARQANRVIGFWREYAKLIEAKSKIKFDSLQYGFLESGKVDTEFGQINKKDKSQKTLYDLFKWEDHAFTKSTIVLGIIFPLGLALFWNLGFVLILYDLRSTFIQHLTLSVWANHLLVGVTCLAPFGLLLGLTYWALGRNLAMPVAVLPTE